MVQMTSFGRQALKKAQDIQDADRSHLTVGLRQLFDYSTFSSILQGTMDMAVPIWIMISAPSKLGVILLQSTPTCASCSSDGP